MIEMMTRSMIVLETQLYVFIVIFNTVLYSKHSPKRIRPSGVFQPHQLRSTYNTVVKHWHSPGLRPFDEQQVPEEGD